MKIVTIVGTRPQFIKAASVSRAIEKYNSQNAEQRIIEIVVHTGQHYDHNMSQIFFDELKIKTPHYNLDIGSGNHGEMTGKMLARIEEVLLEETPDVVLVYGDTNSTLAGALAASKLNHPVAHVEAGLRSYNRRMPEEINRVLTDHISNFLFCPTITAVKNLEKEGIARGVFQVGDVMYDAFLFAKKLAAEKSTILLDLNLKPKQYCLATVHREEVTVDPVILNSIFKAFEEIAGRANPVVVPIHPRTKKIIEKEGIKFQLNSNVSIISPVSYFDMIVLETNARTIFTDSGGIQKEAYFAEVPCITLRDETEWTETEVEGWNYLGGTQKDTILKAYQAARQFSGKKQTKPYGDGTASHIILQNLLCVSQRANRIFSYNSVPDINYRN